MSTSKYVSALAITFLSGFHVAASAQAVLSKSFIQTNFLEDNIYQSQTLLDASNVDQTFASNRNQTLQLRGDLSTGEVGNRVASSANSSAQTIVSLFDAVTFSTSAVISFSARLDGIFVTPGGMFANAFAEYIVGIYDITGMTTWANTRQFSPGLVLANPDQGLTQMAGIYISKESPQDSQAGTMMIDSSQSGSFSATAGRTYGIYLLGNSAASYGASADFSHTGAFTFTNLNGATFTSDSGLFLTQQTAPVPEPSTYLLMVSGLVALCFCARRRADGRATAC